MDYKKLFILFLFFICPVLIYSLITELRFEYGKWIVIILWFSFLGTIYYYRSKIYEKNCLIKELNERISEFEKDIGFAQDADANNSKGHSND